MLTICKNDKNIVIEQIKNKVLDDIVASNSNLIDDIILSMLHEGVLDCLDEGFPDKRRHNSYISLSLIMALAIAAKMKTMTSLTDIPYAIRDHRALAELGYNAVNKDQSKGLLTEGTIRHLLKKYKSEDIFDYYNEIVQNHILKKLDMGANIHILDCTKIAVNIDNTNYEGSTLNVDRKGKKMRGYKLASLRGIYGSIGIIEEAKFGTANNHDLNLCEDLLLETKMLKEGDVILMDRGFLSRKMIKHLKEERKIDVYIPLKTNYAEYDMAIWLAEESDDWKPHPKRKGQMYCHSPNVDSLFNGDIVEHELLLNTCVVWAEDDQTYRVFATTDLSKSAEDILEIYDKRTKIEEDFRQLKEFWKLEDFKSTKLNTISFHIVCVLFGYLFYQLYLMTDDGKKYIGKCLPVLVKNHRSKFLNYLVLYSGQHFCIMSMREFLEFRDSCEEEIREFLLEFFK